MPLRELKSTAKAAPPKINNADRKIENKPKGFLQYLRQIK